MAFHFPLMPRIFMAIAQEDRHPVTEILSQTPEIPENCQWALFLRNHDELTLEMVTDRERDYMYDVYAADPRARVNLGIRRRLAPLMDNDRAKIELLNSLLLSMQGTPIIYYGDEIGMGDNIYLGDRNGVRTPMQWSPDRNGGFSQADPQRLYLPPVMDPVYGYEAVNVEAQNRNASSLLNWMRRLIATRTAHQAFGRGSIAFLHPGNRKILAYLREYGDEAILCVVNLSRSAQPVELDLSTFKGRVPIELLGRSVFPAIGELPYLLSLPRYGFYWFHLASDVEAPLWHVDKLPREELPVLVLPEGLLTAFTARPGGEVQDVLARKTLEQLRSKVLPDFLASQIWFAGGVRRIADVEIVMDREWRGPDGASWLPLLLVVAMESGGPQSYFLPVGLLFEADADRQYHLLSPWMLAKVRQRANIGMLYDALGEDAFCRLLLDGIRQGERRSFAAGEMVFSRTSAFPDLPAEVTVDHPSLEQSNTAIVYSGQLILKVYRRVQPGVNPELEMGRFLNETSPCPNIAPLAGSMEYRAGDNVTAVAVLHRYVPNQGNAREFTEGYLDRFFTLCVEEPDHARESDVHAIFLARMATLGQRCGDLHRALTIEKGDPSFTREQVSSAELAAQLEEIRTQLVEVFDALEKKVFDLTGQLRDVCENLLAYRADAVRGMALDVSAEPAIYKTRVHGNLHLGQILVTHNDFVITDFEGDPDQPLEARRAKYPPLKDVAELCYSLNLTGIIALTRHSSERPDRRQILEPQARAWRRASIGSLVTSYGAAMSGCISFPQDERRIERLIRRYTITKALEVMEQAIATARAAPALEPALLTLAELLAPGKY